ncbi:MAG: PIN domain-containing protein [Deltaproteobacteria bacterium]|nr:PIN domain-containing protein [Deltaproteobacteria bacterium]
MIRYLLDTNVVSETARQVPDPAVIRWIAGLPQLAMASVTLYELRRGIDRLVAGRKRRFLDEWLGALLDSECTVVALDREAALAAAELEAMGRRLGRSVEQRDLLILATARAHGFGVATRNVDHFRGFGVALFDPFEGRHLV